MNSELKNSLVKTYNRHARERDTKALADWKIRERERFAAMLKDQRQRSILEIGAGTGQMSQFFSEMHFDATCTDQSPEMVRLCGEKNLHALLMDFYHLGFAQAHFDAVWALNCLLHAPKKEFPSVLNEICRVLKPGGLFYLGLWGGTDFEGIWEDDPYEPKRFYSFFTDQKIQAVVAEFFEIVDFQTIAVEGMEFHFQAMILRK